MVNFLGLVIDSTAESLLNLVQAYYVGFDFDIDVDFGQYFEVGAEVCLFVPLSMFISY